MNQTQAQTITTLIQFTNVWKYDQSGLELGTAWRTNDYDDSAWPSGAGLLGLEPNTPQVYTVHAPILTPLTISTTVTSYYFRTTFQFFGTTNGLSLLASNLVDDGCVIYLNGFEAGRIRVAANQNATTLAVGGTEGQLEAVNLISASRLRQGDNLLAVEVHQSSVGNSDIMWGMKLMAIQQTPLSITSQPQSQTVPAGSSVNLQVGVSGGPAFYQWQKDGLNIPGATNNPYNIGSAQVSQSGAYRAIITNMINSVNSDAATLTVMPDFTGPRLVSAVVRETGATNRILLQFSEQVLSGTFANSPTTNIANYRVTSCATGLGVAVTNAVQSGSQVQLSLDRSNWTIGGCYFVTVNNVTDIRTNRIAPNSQVPVEWPLHLDLVAIDAPWNFHAIAWADPEVYDEDWAATNYVESSWWAQGNGVFYGGLTTAFSCLGSPQTPTSYQPEPMLFRTTFQWPAHLGGTAQLRPRFIVDDGMVLYLNGVEIWRFNMATQSGSITTNSFAASTLPTANCITNTSITVTNLMPGQNWLAAAVVQMGQSIPASGNNDVIFGLALGASTSIFEPLPAVPAPTLLAGPEGTNAIRLWWTGGGYALESATNLADNSMSDPAGPWKEVPSMSNPYTNSLAAPARFFRLKK